MIEVVTSPRKNMKTPKKEWEHSITDWLKRHEVPTDTIHKFIPYLFKKKCKWDLEAMRSIVHQNRHQPKSAYQEPVL